MIGGRQCTRRFWLPVAIVVALAGCGDSGPPAGGTGTGPRTVQGSLPSPLDAQSPNGQEPTTPGAQPGTPKSVAGSLPPPGATPTGGGAPAQPAAPRAVVTFSVEAGTLRPASRTVSASTPFDLTVASLDGRRHVAVFHAGTGYVLRARPGQPASVTIQGLAAGSYTISSGRSRARLLVAPRS